MAEHAELVGEITMVEKMSTAERLKHAKKRRSTQLKKFGQYDKQVDKEHHKKNKKKENKKGNKKRKLTRVHFVSNVMLLEAAARNDIEEVRTLLSQSVSPDATNEDGLTALHQCCIDDYEDMMKLLIEFGANVNARDSELWTPLHAAATCGHVHLCKYLIEKDAELLAVNADGNMPYDICEDEVTLDFIESEMAKRGVTQELIDETRLSNEKNMLNDLHYIVDKGGDLEFRDRNGATPLHIAAANGYLKVVEFLLRHHTPVNSLDDDQWQPIHAAACWGHPEVLEMLVANGGDLDAKTKTGETTYDICEDPELKERILEMKDEIESSRQTQSIDNRPKRRQSSTRSASVRRTSMREKSAISRKEARDEATLRHSAASDDEDDDVEFSSEPIGTIAQVAGMNGREDPQDKVPTSNIDDISVTLPDLSGGTRSGREAGELSSTTVNGQHRTGGREVTQAAAPEVQDKKTAPAPSLPMTQIWIPDKGSQVSDKNSDKQSDINSDKSTSRNEARSGSITFSNAGTPPHGTLSDLKKQRSMQLQNSLRYRDTKFLNSQMQNHNNVGNQETNGQHMANSTTVPHSERNGHSPSLSNSRNNNNPSYVQPGDPPKRRFTANQPGEIIGADDEKNNCCVIL